MFQLISHSYAGKIGMSIFTMLIACLIGSHCFTPFLSVPLKQLALATAPKPAPVRLEPTQPVIHEEDRAATSHFLSVWSSQAFDYWADSAQMSHRSAGELMSPAARESFAETFWSSKISPKVVRAMVYRPVSWRVISEQPGSMVVHERGTLLAYQSDDALLDLKIELLIVNTRDGKRIERVKVLNFADPPNEPQSFVARACKGLDADISRDAVMTYEEGTRQYNQGNKMGAIAAYKAALQRSPNFALAYYAIGVTYQELDGRSGPDECRVRLALDSHSMALKINPSLGVSLIGRAGCLYRLERYTEALKEYARLVKRYPHNAALLSKLGLCRYLLGENVSLSLKELNQAIVLDPDCWPAFANLGFVQCKERDYGVAKVILTRAIKLNGSDAVSYYWRGIAFSDAKDYERALKDFNVALGLDPTIYDVYRNRAWAYEKLNDFDCALANYDQAIEFKPTALAYMDRGWCRFRHQNDTRGSLIDLGQAIKLDPKLTMALAMRACICRHTGRPQQAHEDLVAINSVVPTMPHQFSVRCNARKELGDYPGAIADLTHLMEVLPDDAPYYRGRRAEVKLLNRDYWGFLDDTRVWFLTKYFPKKPSGC